MKIICTYSGIEYKVPEFSQGTNTAASTAHPIFSWEPKQLLNQSGRWTRNELSATENRLLFLAILKALDLCDWKSPASPSNATVQKNMHELMQVLAWKLDYQDRIPLTRMMIRYPETHTLENISVWIDRWNKRKTEYLTNYKTSFRQDELFKNEEVLARLIKSSHKQTQDYAGQLASWFITAAEVPQGMQERCKVLFRLKGYELYAANKEELENLLLFAGEHLIDHQGSIYGNATMKHIRMLVNKNQLGLKAELTGNTTKDTPWHLLRQGNKFTFEDELPEVTDNMVANAQLAPETKPHQSEIGSKYPTKIDYLRALAYWGQKQTVDAARKAMENSAQQKVIEAEDDIANAALEAEFSHLDDQDDINQLKLGLSDGDL